MTYRKTVALVGAALLLTAGTLTVEDEFIAACEVTLKERLKSPSSYVRKDTSKMLIEPATLDEYLGEEDPEIKQTNEEHANDNKLVAAIRSEQVKRFNREDHYKFTILIRYEAKKCVWREFGRCCKLPRICY